MAIGATLRSTTTSSCHNLLMNTCMNTAATSMIGEAEEMQVSHCNEIQNFSWSWYFEWLDDGKSQSSYLTFAVLSGCTGNQMNNFVVS